MIKNYKKQATGSDYLETLHPEVREYFRILSPVFPRWLMDYINTPAMQRTDGVNLSCGVCYSRIFNPVYWYSNLDHGVGAALIVWHFTENKTQTLAALFHDIATPVFKHCIDFMNGDSEKQESIEGRTEQMIRDSKEIMALLKRDGIPVEEVCDYHDYPIADNDAPRLSSDRLEYTFSSGLTFFRIWNLDDIRRFYNDLTIMKNEEGVEEMGFRTAKVGEEYVSRALGLWASYISDADRTVMQFLADIVRSAIAKGFLTVDDLYVLSEEEVIWKIQNETDDYLSLSFSKFAQAESVYASDSGTNGKYCVSVKAKRRYINPLVMNEKGGIERLGDYSAKIKDSIDDFLNIKQTKYTGFDFEFEPYGD